MLVVIWMFIAMERIQTERKGKTGLRPVQSTRDFLAFFILFLTFTSGCGNKFFDPTQIGRYRPVPAVNVILDSLGVAEEVPMAWELAEEPQPTDTMAIEADYVFRPGDVISVAIYELLREGVQYVNSYVVTETGKISIPEVGVIEVAGLTETQLEEQIKRILSPNILKEPSVSVTLLSSQQRMFSILGDGVPVPGRYPIPRYDFRLTDALATAGGPRQFNVSYIYVSRVVGEKEKRYKPFGPSLDELKLDVYEPQASQTEQRNTRMYAPRAQYRWPKSNVVISASEMITERESMNAPRGYQRWNNDTRSFRDLRNVRQRPTRQYAPETAQEPLSVEEVLKTLSEQPAREQNRIDNQTNIRTSFDAFWEQNRRQNRTDNRRNPNNTLRPSNVTASSQPIDQQIDNERAGRIKWVFQDGKWIPIQVGPSQPEPTEDKEQRERIEWVFQNGKWIAVPVGQPEPRPTVKEEEPGHIEWVFKNGKWVPVLVVPEEPRRPVIPVEPEERIVVRPEEKIVPELEREIPIGARLIKIPTDKLLAGDPRYNIVIKPGDAIHVPVDIVGEFCIMGNVNRTGYVNITGRPMTLKMAIAAAGGLGPLAWPKRCEVVRRIGRKKEEIVMVDLDKIASGEQPDFFIKPNDLINVGTHPTSRWRAILRNAFRATYGFGFVYDRNFADKDFGQYNPITPWKWDNNWDRMF